MTRDAVRRPQKAAFDGAGVRGDEGMRTSRVEHHGGRRGRSSDANRRPPAPDSAPDAARIPPAPATANDPVDEVVDELRAARIRRIREQVATGTYDPPADAVAERLAAFFAGTAVVRFPRRS